MLKKKTKKNKISKRKLGTRSSVPSLTCPVTLNECSNLLDILFFSLANQKTLNLMIYEII